MCLYQLYKRREIAEVKQINGNSNPINLMTKSKVSIALKKLINTNYLELQAIEQVKRTQTNLDLTQRYNGAKARYLPYFTDLKFNQPIRIFYAWHGKSPLACLPLAPWRPSRYVHLLPLTILLLFLLLLLLLSLVSLLDSNCYGIPL